MLVFPYLRAEGGFDFVPRFVYIVGFVKIPKLGTSTTMAKPLSILFVASEIYPIAKTGGVADVAYGLPLALRDLDHDVRVMLPKYGAISERKNRIHEINRLKDIPIDVGAVREFATVKSSSIVNTRTKVQAYMTTNRPYFDSKWGLYSDPETNIEYADNDERFIFFARSVIQTCLLLGWIPQIVHCNDWHTALVAAYMRTIYADKFKNTKIVFTAHNISNQGVFPFKETFIKTGLPDSAAEDLKHKTKFNFMKSGLVYADHITTVSKTYGEQLMSDAVLTDGLNALLKKRKDVFTPIINGIDTTLWTPEKDKLIAKRYTKDSLDKKEANKEALVEKFGLTFRAETPVIAMISRLVEQKGFGLLKQTAEKLFKEDVQLVVLGEGDKDIEEWLKATEKKYPNKMAVRIGFDEPLSHLMEAGADMYLMPSLFEPCGLNQLYSFAYGTVPIARATGGLIDTVKEFDTKKHTGNGFLFEEYKASDMMDAISRALAVFNNKDQWTKLVKNGMSEDHSWNNSSLKYEEIYRKLLHSVGNGK
jgi:starch synthase